MVLANPKPAETHLQRTYMVLAHPDPAETHLQLAQLSGYSKEFLLYIHTSRAGSGQLSLHGLHFVLYRWSNVTFCSYQGCIMQERCVGYDGKIRVK